MNKKPCNLRSLEIMRWLLVPTLCFLCSCLIGCTGSDSGVVLRVSGDSTRLVERGRYLVTSLAACGQCHSQQALPNAPLSGGKEVSDSISSLNSANLTKAEGALKDWDLDDIVRAVRISKRPDQSEISPDIHRGYEWMSDTDLFAVSAYIRTLSAVENNVERRGSGILSGNLLGLIRGRREVQGHVPDVAPSNDLAYGEYLTDHVARCSYCHNSPGSLFSSEGYLAGGRNINIAGTELRAPALSSSKLDGLGNYSESDIVNYLRTGLTPEKYKVNSDFCPINYYTQANESDLLAIAKYLKSL